MLTFEQMLTPVWDTDIVWGESFLMVRGEDGKACAPFLYPPVKILEVSNAAFTESYEEGRDWLLKDGKLCLTPGSRIASIASNEMFFSEEKPGECFAAPGGYSLWKEGPFFHERQICVSYTCRKGGWKGVKPVFSGGVLPRTVQKLRNREGLNMVLFGDSISWGCNASRMSNISPYQASYGDLLSENLTRHYGTPVHFTNTAIGGEDTDWGIRFTERMVNDYDPDLVVLAFGMNDGGKTVSSFEKNIRKIVEKIRAHKPETEFILVATSTPNPILTSPKAHFYGNQASFKIALDHVAEDPAYGGGMAVADIAGMQRELHSRKRFIDTTGNNVNHPNDFFHRCYAQYLSGMLID